ncbi:MAG: DUF4160 domain-containing protein [Oscillospiraceae bacterium]|jgi:hypothetical protein|nr:DUF4160 domain-containing protein [Oscillospiraceae bacterium]
MPELSRFYGIVITMYPDDHNPPHFHVEYNGRKALINIEKGTFIKGSIPIKEARLVLAWYELHKDELWANWSKLKSNNGYDKINPL